MEKNIRKRVEVDNIPINKEIMSEKMFMKTMNTSNVIFLNYNMKNHKS